MPEALEMIIDAKATLGEGPSWDLDNQVLYWVDILQKKVCQYNPASGENRELALDQMPGAVVPRKSGGLAAALEQGFHFVDFETGRITAIKDPESHLSGNRFNDGKCDPKGRFWAGTMSLQEEKGKGALYCLDPDLSVSSKQSDLTISNGLAWSPDHRFMYFIDTPTRKVVRYDYQLDSGGISNPAPIIEIPESEGSPDGMTIDSEGMLWIAHWGGSMVSRWNPATGERLSEIRLPALNVTSCTFGGPDLSDLFITTARNGMSESELDRYPGSGGVFRFKTGIKGSLSYKFNG